MTKPQKSNYYEYNAIFILNKISSLYLQGFITNILNNGKSMNSNLTKKTRFLLKKKIERF